ncbi:ATP synthase mitochondrial F1 complex assembly factor 1 [Mactra antiquata]
MCEPASQVNFRQLLMNYKYNTEVMPSTDILRVCMSCWRRVPSHFSRTILTHRYPESTSLTCNGRCGSRWTSILSSSRGQVTGYQQYSTSSSKEDTDISENPFYKKYKNKLKHMQEEDPEEFDSRLQELKEKSMRVKLADREPQQSEPEQQIQKPDIPGFSGPKTWPPKSLDEVMRIDLVKDLAPESIKQLWQEYHLAKDCIFSVVQTKEYDEIMAKSKLSPNFVFTLPKADGYEFYLCQFSGKDVYYTPLAMYQLVKESAPPCLTVAHFPELKDDKGIVLMAGEYDNKVISKNEALILVKQMALYYGQKAGDRYKILRQFHSSPNEFNHMDIVEQYKLDKDYLEENPY